MVRSYAPKYTEYYRWRGKTIVVEDVPAFVRDHYYDVFIEGEAIVTNDEFLEKERRPQEYVSVYSLPDESRPSLSKLRRKNEKFDIE